MIDSNTLETKLDKLLYIKRLCDARQAGIQYDQVYSNNICFILFVVVGGLNYWFAPFPSNINGAVIAAFVFGIIVRPKLRKKLKSTDERIYTSVYAYASPLSEYLAKKHNTYLARSLKERHDDDYVCIRAWVKMEREAIKDMIYSRSKEGEMREMLIEKGKDNA
ncbi:hypothetical protein [Klebsiella sp. HN106]|uniref:hypothetical protein n=1 Tax=Klebsiella sp. HN106 TaxID=3401058 RepID=UPI003EC121E1